MNENGWKLADMCALILYTAKKSGIADKTLGKLLGIISIAINVPRHKLDVCTRFPNSMFKLNSILNLNPSQCQKVVYICPSITTSKRKPGQAEKVKEPFCHYSRALDLNQNDGAVWSIHLHPTTGSK